MALRQSGFNSLSVHQSLCPSDGMVYVFDSKSKFCGFDSHLGYQLYYGRNQNNIVNNRNMGVI